jgi:hypothetical protein
MTQRARKKQNQEYSTAERTQSDAQKMNENAATATTRSRGGRTGMKRDERWTPESKKRLYLAAGSEDQQRRSHSAQENRETGPQRPEGRAKGGSRQ